MWAEKFSTDSRFLSPSWAYTVMWAEKIQNIRHIIDNISVQAGQNAVARAEKFISGSVFLCPSRAECCREGREIYLRERISLPKPGVYCHVGREIYSMEQISQSKPGIYCHVGREIYSMEQISQSKPGVYCHVGRENSEYKAYNR